MSTKQYSLFNKQFRILIIYVFSVANSLVNNLPNTLISQDNSEKQS